jgi:hypothetical protein
MGLAIMDTLPRRAQKEIKNATTTLREIIPIRLDAFPRTTLIPNTSPNALANALYNLAGRIPMLRLFTWKKYRDWLVGQSEHDKTYANVVTLGGVQNYTGNGLSIDLPRASKTQTPLSWKYLNTGIKNGLKVIIGFIPAFATFALTKNWWLLAYFGAFIWFGITGLRNILQSVLGGGGIRRSPLLKWDDYVRWERVTDSLLFTGFSVPLLDYLTKTVLLDRYFNITTATNPVALFAIMALINGLYISTHNAFRGLPKGAIIGNLFRSILSIPVAIGLNSAVGGILSTMGATDVHLILQKWAAIVSKAASDFVAGIIEGTADRYQNIRIRLRDYTDKTNQLFNAYAKLELLFPDVSTMTLLKSPEKITLAKNEEVRDLEKIIIVHALDLLYFWMYQPRARSAFRTFVQTLSDEERRILKETQFILLRKKKISFLFVEGLVGKNFSKALSFYLDRSREYLNAMKTTF